MSVFTASNKTLWQRLHDTPPVRARPGYEQRLLVIESQEFGTIRLLASRMWCQDCRGSIIPFMATDEIWQQAGYYDGFACLDCLAKRLGRKLCATDLQPIPVNQQLLNLLR